MVSAINDRGLSLSTFSSLSGKVNAFGSKRFTVAGSYLIFLIYSSKISLLVELELLRVTVAFCFGVVIGVGGIEEESSILSVSLMVIHGATIGEVDTGVSIGVISFNLILAFLSCNVLDKEVTNWLLLSLDRLGSSSFFTSLISLTDVSKIFDLLAVDDMVDFEGDVLFIKDVEDFFNKEVSLVSDIEFLALIVEVEEEEEALEEGNELTLALTFA